MGRDPGRSHITLDVLKTNWPALSHVYFPIGQAGPAEGGPGSVRLPEPGVAPFLPHTLEETHPAAVHKGEYKNHQEELMD